MTERPMSNQRWTTVWVVCVLCITAGLPLAARAATTAQEVEEDNSLESKLVTPHKDWAHGYVGGKVCALYVVNGGAYDGTWFSEDTRLREVVELQERFDFSGDAIFVGGSGQGEDFLGMELGKKRAERLLDKPYDVYVFANFALEKLPARFQYRIMEQVAKGAGLVCVGPPARDFMIPKRKINPLPAFISDGLPTLDNRSPAEVINAYRLGKGRGVWLNYGAWTLTPNQLFSWRGLNEYDYRMLWVGRAVLWAAGRENEVSVSLRPVAGDVATQPQDVAATLTSHAPKASTVKIAFELRRASDGWKRSLGEAKANLSPDQPATITAPVALPRLRADDYFVDAVASDARGVVAFGAVTFKVASDFGVDKVTTDVPFVERGQQIAGKAILRGNVPADGVLRLRFRDSYNRVLEQRDIKVTPGQTEYSFDYRTTGFETIQMRVEAVLLVGRDEIEVKTTSFTVPKRRRGQFNFLQWDTPNDVLGYYAWKKMKEAGMSTCLVGSFGPSQPIPALQAADISLVPYSTRILDPKDENGYMKPVCWNDEPNVTKYVQGIVDNQKKHREHGVFVYSLGDEGVTLGCCVHPACIAAYRRYLEKQYGIIDKLNLSWSADYKSFDEVDLLDHKDNMENAALAKGMWARWYDRQAFARYNLIQFSGRFVKAYKQLDPEALTGFEGTGGFGDDYDAILGTNTFYSPYPSIGDDINRSAAPRELIRANWMGYSKTGDALSDAAWRMVMKGMDSIWYWMWTGVGNWRGYLKSTLDFAPAIQDLTDEMQPVRRGLGDLLLKSQMTHSGIGIFYSLPSAISHSIENSRSYMAPEQTHQTWTQLTYDLGLDFRYITSAMLQRGVLTPQEFKVLLLPMDQALSPDEAKIIRGFVQAGGTVIADVRPGIFDGHCKPNVAGALDDVFGIQRKGRENAVHAPVNVKGSVAGQSFDLQVAQARVDADLKAATAQSLGQAEKTPVMFVNQFGKGRAALLSFQLLSDKIDDAQTAATREFLRSLYNLTGVKAAASVASPEGKPLPQTETRIWQDGNAFIIGLWRQMQCAWFSPTSGATAGEPVRARISLNSPLHLYDLRTHKYLGSVSQTDTTLRWGRANFFLALPYRIDGVDATVSSRTPAAGQPLTVTIKLRTSGAAKGRQAVYVEVLDPQGQVTEWGGQALLLNGGVGQVQIPVAYNDAPGKWRVRATELFSNKSAEATWMVR